MSRFSSISAILPCFNEAENIQKHVDHIHAFLMRHFDQFEIIAVDDGSVDDTWHELKGRNHLPEVVLLRHERNRGKGQAIRTGVERARYETILFLDADLAVPIEESLKFYQTMFEEGSDIVIGSRFVVGKKIQTPVLWYRRLLEEGFRKIRKGLLGLSDIQDTQCGFKMFRAPCARELFALLYGKRFAFDAELLFLARAFGYSIRELPITLNNPQESSVRLLYDPLEMLKELLLVRFRYWRGAYHRLSFGKYSPQPGCIRVTLDDFGMNPLVNSRTLELLNHPLVARIGIMPQGEISTQEVATLLESGKPLDIHLERYRVKAEYEKIRSLFERLFEFFWGVIRGNYYPRKMEVTWRAQIETFREVFGRVPDGINSHEHVHFFPFYGLVINRLASEYGISYVRRGKYSLGMYGGVMHILDLCRFFLRLLAPLPKDIATSDYLLVAPSLANISNQKKLLRYPLDRSFELVCHADEPLEYQLLHSLYRQD